jgi:hypothetical protein
MLLLYILLSFKTINILYVFNILYLHFNFLYNTCFYIFNKQKITFLLFSLNDNNYIF